MSTNRNTFSDDWRDIFRQFKPQHKLEIFLLLIAALAITSIGAFSILQFLMEYSDEYAVKWWLAIPLLIIPFGGGIALEQFVAKIENKNTRSKAEKIVGIVAILSFVTWLAGLIDMANVSGYGEEQSFFALPNGTRVITQILFEVTVIALLTSRIFHIIRGYWPDDHLPGAERAALMKECKEYEDQVLRPLQDQIDKIKIWIGPYSGAREKFVQRETAEFLAICAEFDAHKINFENDET